MKTSVPQPSSATSPLRVAALFEVLQRGGFTLRPDDYVLAQRILDTFQPQTPTELRDRLAPLIVTNETEQTRFDRLFDQFFRENEVTLPPPPPPKKLPWKRIVLYLAGLLVAAGLVYVAAFWPGPTFRVAVNVLGSGPYQVGDTVRFSVDSTMQRANPLLRWQWETPDGRRPDTGPTIAVPARQAGMLRVKLRAERGRGRWLTTWQPAGEYAGAEYPICQKLPAIRLDSVAVSRNKSQASYRFTARVTDSARVVRGTRWRLNGTIVAQNTDSWVHTFPASSTPNFNSVSFETVSDTINPLACFSYRNLSVSGPNDNPPFTINVTPTGQPPVLATQLKPFFRQAGLVLASLATLLAGLAFYQSRRRRGQKAGQIAPKKDLPPPFAGTAPPLEIPMRNREREAIALDKTFYRVVRMLRQRIDSEATRLHLRRSIRATVRAGGFPELVYQSRLTETEFLFLIDRSQANSQQVQLFEYLFRAFSRESVSIERYYFQHRFERFFNESHPKGLTLNELSDHYRDRTMIVWSDGQPLLYRAYSTIEPSYRAALNGWEARALLTPVPFTDWARNEKALQEAFLVLPADPIGQVRLMQALGEKAGPQDAFLTANQSGLYSIEYADSEEIDFEEVDSLRNYLNDERLFQWLAALAIAPRLRWEIVVGMGQALLPPEDLNFTALLRLVRIRWIHEGAFPERTRAALLRAMTIDTERVARETLLTLLRDSDGFQPGNQFFDEEKHLLRVANEAILFAHNPADFPEYEAAQREFSQLCSQGLYPDGPTRRYLENPSGGWTTLVKGNQPLSEYFRQTNEPVPKPDEPVPPRVRRWAIAFAIFGLLAVGFWGVLGLATWTNWPVFAHETNPDQPVNLTVLLQPTACLSARNTDVTDDSTRWTVFLDDSLMSVSNLQATRVFALNDLRDSGSGSSSYGDESIWQTLREKIAAPFQPSTAYRSLEAKVTVRDSSGREQTSYVALTGDTLRVAVNCFILPPDTLTKLRVDIFYSEENQSSTQKIAQKLFQGLQTSTLYDVREVKLSRSKINKLSGYLLSRNEIRFDADEKSKALQLKATAEAILRQEKIRFAPYGVSRANPTVNYVSIFIFNPTQPARQTNTPPVQTTPKSNPPASDPPTKSTTIPATTAPNENNQTIPTPPAKDPDPTPNQTVQQSPVNQTVQSVNDEQLKSTNQNVAPTTWQRMGQNVSLTDWKVAESAFYSLVEIVKVNPEGRLRVVIHSDAKAYYDYRSQLQKLMGDINQRVTFENIPFNSKAQKAVNTPIPYAEVFGSGIAPPASAK